MSGHLSKALLKIKENNSRNKRPPRGKHDTSYLNNSALNNSIEKASFSEKLKILKTSMDLSKSNINCDSYNENDKSRDNSRSRLKNFLGKAYYDDHENNNTFNKCEISQISHNGGKRNSSQDYHQRDVSINGKGKLKIITEPHDCIYR